MLTVNLVEVRFGIQLLTREIIVELSCAFYCICLWVPVQLVLCFCRRDRWDQPPAHPCRQEVLRQAFRDYIQTLLSRYPVLQHMTLDFLSCAWLENRLYGFSRALQRLVLLRCCRLMPGSPLLLAFDTNR